MKLTTKGRYAVTAMLDLALNQRDGTISLADISKRQEISLSYLEQLFSKLRRNDLVKSVRGPGGGYRLAQDASQINIAMIIEAVNEQIDATACGGDADCRRGEACLTHHLWMGLTEKIQEFLRGISIESLIMQEQIQQVNLKQNASLEGQKIPLTSL